MLFIGLVFGACSATTPIVSEWRNPAYTSGSFKRIMVGVLGGDTSVRRNFEDEFVAQLRPAGIDALTSYQFTPDSEKIDEVALKEAALKAGADAGRPTHVKHDHSPTNPGASPHSYNPSWAKG